MAKEPLSPRIRQILLLGTMIALWLLAMAAADGVMHWSQKAGRTAAVLPAGEFKPFKTTIIQFQNGESRTVKYFKISLAGISPDNQERFMDQIFEQVAEDSSNLLNAGTLDFAVSNFNSSFIYKTLLPDNQGFLFMGFLVDQDNLKAISYFGTGTDSIQDDVYFQSMVIRYLGN